MKQVFRDNNQTEVCCGMCNNARNCMLSFDRIVSMSVIAANVLKINGMFEFTTKIKSFITLLPLTKFSRSPQCTEISDGRKYALSLNRLQNECQI